MKQKIAVYLPLFCLLSYWYVEFAVLSALTVGYKEELSEDLRETYQVAGVSHILALSGMHIAVL